MLWKRRYHDLIQGIKTIKRLNEHKKATSSKFTERYKKQCQILWSLRKKENNQSKEE